MFRGCFLVTGKRGVPPMFSSSEFLSRQETAKSSDNADETSSHHILRRTLVDGFLQSIDMLGPLCMDPVEKRLHLAMKSIIEQTYNVAASGGKSLFPSNPLFPALVRASTYV